MWNIDFVNDKNKFCVKIHTNQNWADSIVWETKIENLITEDYICLSFTKPWCWKCWTDISQLNFRIHKTNWPGLMQTSTLVCVYGSILFLVLIRIKLSGLNSLIRSILYFMAIQDFVCNFALAICTSLMYFWRLQNIATCLVSYTSYCIIRVGTLTSLALISQVRYYIALKTFHKKVYLN